jgi:16S rRNA (cytidine1402-2'-O)-methyltransferase
VDELLQALERGDVALVTDAGTPGLSDPGGDLVAAAWKAGFEVVAVPGASALLALVASSGLEAARFTYLGFLPRRGKERADLIGRAAQTGWPFVIYESAQRLAATLDDLLKSVGDRPVAVGRELTKLHEEVYTGTISGASAHFGSQKARGEVTIMVGASRNEADPAGEVLEADLDRTLIELQAQGLHAKEVARQAALLAGVGTRDAYNRLMKLRGSGS